MWVIFGTITAYCAQLRGRDPYAWFAIGMMLQLIGLVMLFLLPSLSNHEQETSLERDENETLADWSLIRTEWIFQNKDWYYVNADLVQQGPITFEDLQKAWADGNMSRQTFVWCESMPAWKKINEMPGFENALRESLLPA